MLYTVDEETFAKTGEVALPDSPWNIVLHPDEQHLFILYGSSGTIAVMDLATLTEQTSLTGLNLFLFDAIFNADGTRLYASHADQQEGGISLIRIDSDCNSNGIPDQCDIDCGLPGDSCDVPGCGQSQDYNTNGIPDECDTMVQSPRDDFEDGVIDSSLWSWGGARRGMEFGGGSWQWSHEEVVSTNGYLSIRVWGPTSGGTYGGEGWVRTKYDYNDGFGHVIDFQWEAEVNAWHCDYFAIHVTDGTIPGTSNVHWLDLDDEAGWTTLYVESQPGDTGLRSWSIRINATDHTATLFDGATLHGITNQSDCPVSVRRVVSAVYSL